MTTALTPTPLFDQVIRERRSVRKYDPDFEVTEQDIKDILSDAILAPSSSNLQPWRFLVIKDKELKQQLLSVVDKNNEHQVVTSSAIIAVLGDKEAYRYAGEIYQELVTAGVLTQEMCDAIVKTSTHLYSNSSDTKLREIALVDGGIVSQQLILAAKARGYDTLPMGGYDPDAFRKFFNVPDRYVPVMLIAVGKAEVGAAQRFATRRPLEDVTSWNAFNFEA
ncbi:nitroreductase family protein [Paenibacillus sp. GCM10012307]|uniref:Nitroreductase family protein n=1 Tax=Paenibacillus roseus TaxID=2798579 RepID=A0A934MXM4_9BACL|nr:nitroreductase family protein [Paenibacillus roseus]MBJ6364332.1 nitroreductase family protein [Paenibacillus roseus]